MANAEIIRLNICLALLPALALACGARSGPVAPLRSVAPTERILLAGTPDGSGFADGSPAASRFNHPRQLVWNPDTGILYVADAWNHVIRAFDGATWSTLAGTPKVAGTRDGPAQATFTFPTFLALDGASVLYVGETGRRDTGKVGSGSETLASHALRKVWRSGAVTTYAIWPTAAAPIGAGMDDLVVDGDGQPFVLDTAGAFLYQPPPLPLALTPAFDTALRPLAGVQGQPGTTTGDLARARLLAPSALAFLGLERTKLLVADQTNLFGPIQGLIQVLDRQQRSLATWADPYRFTTVRSRWFSVKAMAADGAGNLVLDFGANTLWRLTPGNGPALVAGAWGVPGSREGQGGSARFGSELALAAGAAGEVFVADATQNVILKVTATGAVTRIGGSAGVLGARDARGALASFSGPGRLALDGAGNALVADVDNHKIRQVAPDGTVTTLAGFAGAVGPQDGPLATASFGTLAGLAVTGAGAERVLYVTDDGQLRKVAGGAVTTLAGQPGNAPPTDGIGLEARFEAPGGLALDPDGSRILVADGSAIRAVDLDTLGVTTLFSQAGADFQGVALGPDGTLYATDTQRGAVWRIGPAGDGQILAGAGSGFQDGPARQAQFKGPTAIAVDPANRVFVADTGNDRVRGIYQDRTSAWQVATVAEAQPAAAGVPGRIVEPRGLGLTPTGDLVVTSGNALLILTHPLSGTVP